MPSACPETANVRSGEFELPAGLGAAPDVALALTKKSTVYQSSLALCLTAARPCRLGIYDRQAKKSRKPCVRRGDSALGTTTWDGFHASRLYPRLSAPSAGKDVRTHASPFHLMPQFARPMNSGTRMPPRSTPDWRRTRWRPPWVLPWTLFRLRLQALRKGRESGDLRRSSMASSCGHSSPAFRTLARQRRAWLRHGRATEVATGCIGRQDFRTRPPTAECPSALAFGIGGTSTLSARCFIPFTRGFAVVSKRWRKESRPSEKLAFWSFSEL